MLIQFKLVLVDSLGLFEVDPLIAESCVCQKIGSVCWLFRCVGVGVGVVARVGRTVSFGQSFVYRGKSPLLLRL